MDFSAWPETTFLPEVEKQEEEEEDEDEEKENMRKEAGEYEDETSPKYFQFFQFRPSDDKQRPRPKPKQKKPKRLRPRRLIHPTFEQPSSAPPPEVLLRQQVKVLFLDVENMLTLFTQISPSDHPAKLRRCLQRFTMYLARLDTILRAVWLPKPELARARSYRAQLKEVVWAMQEIMGLEKEEDEEEEEGKYNSGSKDSVKVPEKESKAAAQQLVQEREKHQHQNHHQKQQQQQQNQNQQQQQQIRVASQIKQEKKEKEEDSNDDDDDDDDLRMEVTPDGEVDRLLYDTLYRTAAVAASTSTAASSILKYF